MHSIKEKKIKFYLIAVNIFLALFLVFFTAPIPTNALPDFQWVKQIGGAGSENIVSINADSNNNIYISGVFSGISDFDPGAAEVNLTSAGGNDVFVSKFDSNDNLLWVKQIGDLSNETGFSVVDADGDIYLAGSFENTVDFDPGIGVANLTSLGLNDIYILKLNSNGDFLWVKQVGGTLYEDLYNIQFDSNDNLLLEGFFSDTVDFDPGIGVSNLIAAPFEDNFYLYLNTDGEFVSAEAILLFLDSLNFSKSDSYGNTYFVEIPNCCSNNIFLRKYSPSSSLLWSKLIAERNVVSPKSIAINTFGDIYIAGQFSGTGEFNPSSLQDYDLISDPPPPPGNLITSIGANDAFIFKISQEPVISEITPIGVVVNNGTISYTFTTNEAGTITYGGSCSSATTVATVGSNTITLNPLSAGTYTDCTITVTDVSSNISTPLSISSFDIVVHSGGGGGGSTTTLTEPTPATPKTPTTPEPTPQPETIIPIIPTEPITPPVICNQGELYNANTGEACTSFLPVLVEPISEPEIIVTPKPIVKQKPIITEIKTEVLPPQVTEVTIPTTSIPENTNTQSNTEPTLEEKYPDIPIPVREEETNSESILEYINRQARESFKETINIANQGKEKIKEILATKEGNITSKAVTIGGIVAGTSSMVASIAFATPLSFSEIPLIPLRMWTLFLGFLGIKKRTRRWGVVYDSVTKQPLDPAYVTLKNLEGQKVATTITDIDGRYGFVVDRGMYTIAVNKTNYTFPSLKLANKQTDELYDSLYLGDSINVSTPDEVITKNIPLDPINFSWNENEKAKKGLTTSFNNHDLLISRIFNFLFILGFIIAFIALLIAPQPYNGIIFTLYLTIFILKKVGIQTKNKGSVIEKATGLPLSNGIIRLFYTDIGQEVAHAIIDKSGKFYCLVQNGTYKVQIDKKNLDGSYTPLYQQGLVTVTNGVLNMGFRV